MNNKVDHPPHYNALNAHCSKCYAPIECIDVTRHMSFNIGNAVKYLWRCDHKGEALEDLKKALWYIQDEINTREQQLDSDPGLCALGCDGTCLYCQARRIEEINNREQQLDSDDKSCPIRCASEACSYCRSKSIREWALK